MKKIVFALLIAFTMPQGYAQDSLPSISRATWVVESNVSSPTHQVIKFYNQKLELIYEETVRNRKIRYHKERIKKALNKTLDLAIKTQNHMEPGTFVAVLKSKTH